MEQAEYCDPEPSDAPVASLRIPGDTRVLLLALVLTMLGLPIIAADTFGASGDSESIVVEAAAATSETTTPAPAPSKVIQVLSDGDERVEQAYQQARAAQQADEVTATTEPEADEAPSTTEAPQPAPTAPPTTRAPAPAPAAPVGDIWGRLAQCESGGNWAHQGSYHGGLQFHPSTWTAFGGTQYAPYAYQATAAQQIAVAERVVAAAGGTYRGWPGCRARLGLP